MSRPGTTNNPNGRPPGRANKRNKEINEYAESQGINPAHILIDILSGSRVELGKEPLVKDDYKWAIDTLMPYMFGKRKPIDSDGNDASDPVTAFIEAISGSKQS